MYLWNGASITLRQGSAREHGPTPHGSVAVTIDDLLALERRTLPTSTVSNVFNTLCCLGQKGELFSLCGLILY